MAERPTGRAASPPPGADHAGAPTSVLGAHSRGIRTYEAQGVGGGDHLVSEGTLRVAQGAAFGGGGGGEAASRGPRGQAGGPRPPPGGPATVVLGSDSVSYTCSTSESQWRPAVSPEERAAVASQATAGGRAPVYELGARRRNGVLVHPTHPVGGATTVRLDDGSGGGRYSEGIKEAQYAAALNPAAREEAAAMDTAGRRVQPKGLGSIVRTTQPVGGRDTGTSAIVTGKYIGDGNGGGGGGSSTAATGSSAASVASSSSHSAASPLKRSIFSPVPDTGADAVGANSSRFLAAPSEPALPLRSSNDRSAVGALVFGGGGGGSSGSSGGAAAVLSPRDRKVTADGVCKAVGGWVGSGYHGLDEVNSRLGVVSRQ